MSSFGLRPDGGIDEITAAPSAEAPACGHVDKNRTKTLHHFTGCGQTFVNPAAGQSLLLQQHP
jgi:hypothetical protein